MDQNESSILSFRDIPPHQRMNKNKRKLNSNNGNNSDGDDDSRSSRRVLYKPSHDLVFDLEMSKRNDSKLNYSGSDPDPDQEVKFGSKQDDKVEVEKDYELDEETLKRLCIPPPPPYVPGLENHLRSNSIFVYNRSIALLRTDQIMNYLFETLKNSKSQSGFDSLEWIDDFSCVMSFNSMDNATQAYRDLLIRPEEIEGENGLPEAIAYLESDQSPEEVKSAASDFILGLRPAKPFNQSLFQENTKKNNPSLLRPTQPDQLIPFIRFATLDDVKKKNASKHSLFYALNGRDAGKDGIRSVERRLPKTIGGNATNPDSKRRRSSDNMSIPSAHTSIMTDPKTGRWLKGDLDDEIRPSELGRRISSSFDKRQRRQQRNQRPKNESALDDELDRFMAKNRKRDKDDGNDGFDRYEGDQEKNGSNQEGRYDDDDDNDENFRRQKRIRHSNEQDQQQGKPIELLSGKEVGGGNLGDQLFQESQDEHTNQEGGEDGSKTMTRRGGESSNLEDDLKSDEEILEESVEVIDEETGKKINRTTLSRRKKINYHSSSNQKSKSKNRWGPLFSRLF